MAVKRLYNRREQFFDSNGNPASGAFLFFYAAGSSTKQNTFNSSVGNVANSNPITLNSRGEPGAEVWGTVGQTYKIVLAPSTDSDPPASPIWTEDNIAPINDTATSIDEWQDSGLTPTFIGVSSFSFAGDQTTEYTVGRRLKFTVSGGTVYGRITASVFTTLTTITLQMDGTQQLDSGLSAVSKSILRSNVLALPERIATASGTDTYTAAVGITRRVVGDEFKVKIANANTLTTSTLNLDSTGAATVVRIDGSAIKAGDLKGEHTFRWDGTNYLVLNPANTIKTQTANRVFAGPTTGGAAVPDFRALVAADLPLTVGLVKLDSGSASGATLDIVMTAHTAYRNKRLVFNLVPATDAVSLTARVSTDGGGTYDSGASNYSMRTDDADNVAVQTSFTSDSTLFQIGANNVIGNGATEGCNGVIEMYDTINTARWPQFLWEMSYIGSNGTPQVGFNRGVGTRRAAQDTDAFRLLFSSGNIASGNWVLYGYN